MKEYKIEKTVAVRPCGKTDCIFADCVSVADGNDGVAFSLAPCESFDGCPNRLGILN